MELGLPLSLIFSVTRTRNGVEEGVIVNALGVTLVALGIAVSFAVRRSNAPATAKVYVTERL